MNRDPFRTDLEQLPVASGTGSIDFRVPPMDIGLDQRAAKLLRSGAVATEEEARWRAGRDIAHEVLRRFARRPTRRLHYDERDGWSVVVAPRRTTRKPIKTESHRVFELVRTFSGRRMPPSVFRALATCLLIYDDVDLTFSAEAVGRLGLGTKASELARRFGCSVRTVQSWRAAAKEHQAVVLDLEDLAARSVTACRRSHGKLPPVAARRAVFEAVLQCSRAEAILPVVLLNALAVVLGLVDPHRRAGAGRW